MGEKCLYVQGQSRLPCFVVLTSGKTAFVVNLKLRLLEVSTSETNNGYC